MRGGIIQRPRGGAHALARAARTLECAAMPHRGGTPAADGAPAAAALADAATASVMQRAFVGSRIARYDRPDLDDLFATAVGWLGGARGYPMAVALLNDGRPFAGWAGISADDRGERPSLHRFAL